MATAEGKRELFLIATGQDTGGWNWRIREAFARNSASWTARSMAATKTYIQYPEDLPYRQRLCEELYAAADVIHLQNQLAGYLLYDQGAGKPVVLQHHGTIFREGHEALSRQARAAGMVEVASTLDLTLLEPGVEWVPVPYQLAELQRIRRDAWQPSSAIRIAHAPTNRAVKGTDHFLRVFATLARRHRLELVLIENRTWRQCLQMKARADVFYDQLELGYGCNAVEAWGMGLPVVAGVADPAVRAAMLERWGRLPFADAEPDTLEYVLEQLIISEQARREAAELGREHFDRWHDERVVTPWLEGIYGAAPATVPGPVRELRRGLGLREARRQERQRRQEQSLDRALAQRAKLRAERATRA